MWRLLLVAVILVGCGDNDPGDCSAWRQWGNDGTHAGASCAVGQPLTRAIAAHVFDPFTSQEQSDTWRGDLVVHYQAPLVDGDAVFMLQKSGTYTPCKTQMIGSASGPDCTEPSERDRLDSQVWSETRSHWEGDTLAHDWTFDSDWKPVPFLSFEQMFQPVLVGEHLWVPGAGGAVWELDAKSGKVVRHVTPFGKTLDPDTFVAGALSYARGTVYYTAIQLGDPRGWLVAVDTGNGAVKKADFGTLAVGAPRPTDTCYGTYSYMDTPLPWPPLAPDGTAILPPGVPCGPQLPGINAAVAIGADGTLFAVSHDEATWQYSYVIAARPDLTPIWATSLRGTVNDGCGVTIPADGTETNGKFFDCRVGSPAGIDPSTGQPPAPRVDDDSSSSPVALPDGGVLYGALNDYNDSRGHLIKLDAHGKLVATYDFGWDTTPAVVPDGDSYAVVLKDNHYGTDSQGFDSGPYYITELDANLNVKWQFKSTNTQSCARLPDGTMSCKVDHPHGFEWCINAPAVDASGTIYVNSEDGNLYAIGADGTERDHHFLFQSLGAAYTPLSLDAQGRVYSENDGTLMVVGK